MRRPRIIVTVLYAVLAVSALGACSAMPEDRRHSVRGAGDQAALRLACVGSGISDVAAGTLEGGLEGAAAGLAVSAEAVNGQADNEAAWVVIGGGAALGGALGAGAGFGNGIIRAAATYAACLRTRGPDFGAPSAQAPQT